ncbi:ROK family transcriptional regulator [Novosphingobium profundi]|uniref:ROK family transcriptional regulator n=1 Tax=Novosphingobium profundi TaxID=1774954 RepID=UPI001CFD0FB3|nr:ROK family transcriptional regulator [Novosphingobium profundi]
MSSSAVNSRLHVLNCIRRHKAISRVELVTESGLSAGSISNITRELVDHGIVREIREPAEGRGRPRLALSINSEAATMAGMLLYPSGCLHVQITNLMGDILEEADYPLPPALAGGALADTLAECLRSTVANLRWDLPRPHAAGVGFFGTVQAAAGILHWLPPAIPQAVPIQDMLERRLGIPVFIDNQANVIARAECWRTPEEGIGLRHFLQVGLDLSLATTRDGAVLVGGRGVNPEFGHVKTSLAEGLPCWCGGSGCLGTVASVGGIALRDAAMAAPSHDEVHALAAHFPEIAERARAGENKARALFEDAGTALGLSLANLVNLSNPDAVRVIVEEPAWIELAGPALTHAFSQNLLSFLGEDFPLTLCQDDRSTHGLGAIALVAERLFQDEPLPDWN